jgi:hypothetical protein
MRRPSNLRSWVPLRDIPIQIDNVVFPLPVLLGAMQFSTCVLQVNNSSQWDW